MKWIGPFEILSKKGVKYKASSKEGRSIVMHHNNFKQSAVPVTKGVLHCPVPASTEINFVEGPTAPGFHQLQ